MSDKRYVVDWEKTTFDGNRREQLRRASAMTVRQRLEALDQLTELSERMQAMPREAGVGFGTHSSRRKQSNSERMGRK